MIQGVGGNASLNNLNQSLSAISGQDFNSRLSVTRQTDNTLYVRIGPTNQASTGSALAAQSYDIALLLLAPRIYFDDQSTNPPKAVDRQIRIVTQTEFLNASDGSILPDRPIATLVEQFDRVMRRVFAGSATLLAWEKLSKDPDKEVVARTLAGPIQANNFALFETKLNVDLLGPGSSAFNLGIKPGYDEAKSLWGRHEYDPCRYRVEVRLFPTAVARRYRNTASNRASHGRHKNEGAGSAPGFFRQFGGHACGKISISSL